MADLDQNVTNVSSGAYGTMVLLSDGSIEKLGKFYQNKNGRTINRPLAGAYANLANSPNGIIAVAADVKASGGKQIAGGLLGGYNDLVVVDGQLVSLTAKIDHDENNA